MPADAAFRAAAGRARPRPTPARSWPRSGRPRRPSSIRLPRSPTAAAAAGAWLHVDAAYAGRGGGLPGAAPPLRRLGAGRLDRRQPAQVAVHADGLLGVLLPPARRPPAGVQPRARVPAGERGRRQPERVRLAARPPLPGAEAVGDAALLRPRGPAGDHPRARAARASCSSSGSRAEPGWELCAPRPFSLVCFRTERQRRGERGDHGARQRQRRRSSSRTRSSTAASCCGSRSATRARARRTSRSPGTCCARQLRRARLRLDAAPRPAGSGRAPG